MEYVPRLSKLCLTSVRHTKRGELLQSAEDEYSISRGEKSTGQVNGGVDESGFIRFLLSVSY